jgi:para-nitrobenzyl esterase
VSDATLRIELPTGWIEGVHSPVAETSSSRPLRIFKGIPYAAPTDGDKRWLPPQPVTPWTGIRLCNQFGATAVQANLPGIPGYAGDFDCLNLNVWCPIGEGPWPVMVWIPGGGFMRGGTSDALYDGRAIASAGVVFVSINYRVGVDGFMHFEDAAPNRGLLDQLAALLWVHQNIALFGGDPTLVTVAGVSAGAGAITHIMGLPASDSLFQRAILQSPSLQSHNLEDAAQIRCALAGALGTAPTRQALESVPMEALTKTLTSFLGNESLKKQYGLRPRNFFPVRPVIDGDMLQREPLQAIEQQLQHGAPKREVLLGFNSEEMRFYLVPNGEIDRIDQNRVLEFIQDIGWPHQTLGEYQAKLPLASMGDVMSCIQSDYYYCKPTLALEQLLHNAGCTTYLYEFGWSSPLHGGRMGAAHAMEIPFVLGNTASERAQAFIGSQAPQTLANDMHSRWIRFVKGEPMPDWANANNSNGPLRLFKPTSNFSPTQVS